MSIASFIVLIVLVIIFFKKHSLKDKYIAIFSLLMVFQVFINIGYFVNIGSIVIDFEELLTGILALLSVFLIYRNQVNRSIYLWGFCFLSVVVIGLIIQITFPYEKGVFVSSGLSAAQYVLGDVKAEAVVSLQTYRYLIRLILYIIIATALFSIRDNENINNILNGLIKFAPIVVVFCIFEFVSKNVLHIDLDRQLLELVFNQSGHVGVRAQINVLNGFRYEPTQLATGLWEFAILVLFSNKSSNYKNRMILIVVGIILATVSLKGFQFILLLFFLFVIYNKSSTARTRLVLIATVFMIAAFAVMDLSYIGSRFQNAVLLGLGYGVEGLTSEGYRIKTITEAFSIFMDRPLAGIGVGVAFAYGAIPMTLSNIGVLGTTFWILFVRKISNVRLDMISVIVLITLLFVYVSTGTIATLYNPSILLFLILLGYKSREGIVSRGKQTLR